MIVSDARAFQSTLIFKFTEEHVYFGIRHTTWPVLSWNTRHRTDNLEMF